MVSVALDNIKNLPPGERIKRLKEIEEEKKREIKEAEALIKDSLLEIDERAEERLAPTSIRETSDITQLVSAEERQIFRNVTGASEAQQNESRPPPRPQSLEEVAQEAPETKKEGENTDMLYSSNAKGGVEYGLNVTPTGKENEPANLYQKGEHPDLYRQNQEQQALYHERQDEEDAKGYDRRKHWEP